MILLYTYGVFFFLTSESVARFHTEEERYVCYCLAGSSLTSLSNKEEVVFFSFYFQQSLGRLGPTFVTEIIHVEEKPRDFWLILNVVSTKLLMPFVLHL